MDNAFPIKLLVRLASQGPTTARDEVCEKFGLKLRKQLTIRVLNGGGRRADKTTLLRATSSYFEAIRISQA